MNRNERRRAAKTDPNPQAGGLARGFARHQAGDLTGAEAEYRKILATSPNHADAARLLGEVLLDRGKPDEAVLLLTRIVKLYPAQPVLRYTLATALRLAGQTTDAINQYRAALAGEPNLAPAHHGLGAALLTAGQDAAAADSFAAATRAKPDWPLAWSDLGTTLATLGRFSEAAPALAEALRLDPHLADARRHLAALSTSPVEAEISTLQAVLAKPGTPGAALLETRFALGKMLDRAGRYDEAFAEFVAANRMLREAQTAAGAGFDPARLRRDGDKIIGTFGATGFAARAGWGVPSELPVFIVGMPRSGTSLVEQILASHGGVFGAGEITGIGRIAAAAGWSPATWSNETIRQAGQNHINALGALAPGKIRIIDKMPDNIFQLGLIATLFPRSRIIFCARDPLDTCFSCFTQRFAQPLGYDTDLADCGFRFRQIEQLTAHWQATLPLPMLTVGYEALIGDLEAQTRIMVEFLGLDWDAACLDFHRTKRTVKTASWAQVRRPVYNDSVGRARQYLPHLKPLIDALEAQP